MARKPTGNTSTATIGFEPKLWLSADTATRASADRDCAATWRDLCGAQDHRNNPIAFAAF